MNIERSRSFAVHRAIALFAAVLLTHPAAPSARAETGVTNIINGVSTNAGGAYWVGNTGPFNALIITNGGTLIATDTGLGYAAASSNNFALVTGAGSLWTNSDFFAVGRAGGGNLLRITDGGKVINGGETRIGWADSASNNTVIVSGAGSVLASLYGYFYYTGVVYVGDYSAGNQLTITNGGQVIDGDGIMGYRNGGNNNAVTVTGSGSVWRNNQDFFMGYDAGANSNRLTIADNGAVTVGRNAYLGLDALAVSNTITLAGGSLIVTNANANGTLDAFSGTITLNSGTLDVDVLLLTNNTASATNAFLNLNGGTLITRASAQIVAPGDDSFIIGNTAGQTGAWNIVGGTASVQFVSGTATILGGVAGAAGHVTVTGAGSLWTNANPLLVGWSGSGSQLTITNGGEAVNGTGFIGYNAGADSNAVTVTGSGSVWRNNGSLSVGFYGAGNQMTILNSGLVINADGYLGRYASATGNAVTVSGPGSVWSNSSYLWVGDYGSGNQVTILNSGLVVNANGYIGYNSGASNAVTVNGDGSLWRNTANLYVGNNGVGNQLTVTNGGRVANVTGYVGYNVAANNNSALVTGANSLWTNSGDLFVGYAGDGNSLTIANSGKVLNAAGTIGYTGNSNAVLVSGAGALWRNIGNLVVGGSGAFNQLTILPGGVVSNVTGYIGAYVGNRNNAALVSGTGAVWYNSGTLIVGNNGSSNQLTIQSGGLVRDNGGTIGGQAGSHDNAVLVTGTGSEWRHLNDLEVGSSGFSNQLTIQAGGVVRNNAGWIGKNASASNNAVTVTGAGSVWTNTGELYIGGIGSGNQMTIADGGRVVSAVGYLGSDVTANNNTVTVNGNGSVWTNSSGVEGVYVGLNGSGNQLTITNGGRVFSSSGFIGYNSPASNNAATVSGNGSLWSIATDLHVGRASSNNSLTLANNGAVTVGGNAYVGFNTGSFNNAITLGGGSLTVTNAAATGTLDVRRGTLTLNSGTVTVNRLVVTNGASSVMNFSAGLLRSGGSSVSNGVAFTVGDGVQAATLDLVGGDHSFANGLSISTNGNLVGNGNIIGSATNFGVIAPGHSAGLLTFSGDLDLQDSSTLNFEIGGTSTNDYDRLFVSGYMYIAGQLNVTWTNGYTGSGGDTFDLFDFGSVSGAFSQTNLPALSGALQWDTSQLYTSGGIFIVPEPASGLLLALGLAALGGRKRSRAKIAR